MFSEMKCSVCSSYLSILCFCALFYVALIAGDNKYSKPGSGGEYCHVVGEKVYCENVDAISLKRLEGKEIGFYTELNILDNRSLTMKTVSMKPLIFEIPDFLSDEECEHFIEVAKKQGLQDSITKNDSGEKQFLLLLDMNKDKKLSYEEMILTIENSFDIYPLKQDIKNMYEEFKLDTNQDGFITPEEMQRLSARDLHKYLMGFVKKKTEKHSRMSKQVWLYPDTSTDNTFSLLQQRVQKLTGLPEILIKKSDFQVVKYDSKGHYNAHHDSTTVNKQIPCCTRQRTTSCRICRYMTVLFYLNDVTFGGETAFPMANNETYDEHVFRKSWKVNLYENCDKANLLVKPEKGKAVIWYNHFVDKDSGWLGELDNYTWHGGCPVVEGEKWIANFWIKVTDDKYTDLE